MKALIGQKVGMTQIVGDDGSVMPATLIQAGPCTVTQVKNTENDGYNAIQLGFGEKKHPKKPQVGHTKQAKLNPVIIREHRTEDIEEVAIGDSFNVSVFEPGEKVNVTGTSKGKGFAGTIKRWNFNTGPKTHGSRSYRRPGSIGSMYPQKIFKGKKMAGRMGHAKRTTKNLEVLLVDTEKNLIAIKGSVPGPKKSYVTIREAA